MTNLGNLDRTWMGTVVFMDIVNYSSRSVELQIKLKTRFNGYLAKVLQDVPESDRVILDTGDGAAICFLGAPEAAMFAALHLCEAFVLDAREQQPGLFVRIGINLGPVKLVKDINGALNALGDGINAGQRIMGFAAGNQILVSQSFFEVVSRLSDDYKQLFQLKGVETDKHVREHTVYHLLPPGSEQVEPVVIREAGEQTPFSAARSSRTSVEEHPPDAPSPTVAGLAPSSLSAGTRLGNYEILEQLGSGGKGKVYRAKDTRLGREVAIKTISLDRNSPPENRLRFEPEPLSASALTHPNIVTIYELGSVNGTNYIAMELVVGKTVREMLSLGPIPFRQTITIAAQIADALARAHEAGIIHCDVKPENLMVSNNGTPKILDFGLAKLLPPGNSMNINVPGASTAAPAGSVVGTMGYMSPEQASGADVDFRSDQFSFGSVLYEMVTGVPAFRKRTAEKPAAILGQEPLNVTLNTFQAPAPFVWIVNRCLSRDPKGRYASTSDLARELAAVRDHILPGHHVEARPSNLPVPRTAFIGREPEMAALQELLSQQNVRLVTMTGPGGIGKTRLALEVVNRMAAQFPGGVAFVALSMVREPETISSAIAAAIGVRAIGNQSPQESLRDYLSGQNQPMLLLLDNFEHLVSTAPMVADLLSIAPSLKIVVTSQASLHVYGEHEFCVPPLGLPNPKSLPPVDVLSRMPAVALFVERAKAVKGHFALTKENAPSIAAICARLDGLPLAIELAAARIKLLSPSTMLARLESCLDLLTGGARDMPIRQQTLRGTVDWSYRLLNTQEQILFRRLSVFMGGCTLDGVEAVCDTKGDLGVDVLDCMASLVDKSLIRQIDQHEGETRFYMLSIIREFALERLAESCDEPATQRAHAAYQLVLAEEGAGDATAGPGWFDRLELEHNNLRAALDYLLKIGDADWGLRLGTALFRFWETREHLAEGRGYISRLLELQGAAAHPKLRSHLIFAVAVLALEQGDNSAAQTLFEENLETCTRLEDVRGVAIALNAIAVTARDRGDLAVASKQFERCLTIWRDLGAFADIARALSNLATVTKLQGEFSRAATLYNESMTMFHKVGDGAGVAWALNYQGDIARENGDRVGALSFYEESLKAFRQLQDGWGTASVLSDLASLHRDQGDHDEARRLYEESIKLFEALGHRRGIARVLESIAVTIMHSRAERSLRLAGAAAALRQRLGAPLAATEQPRLEKALQSARQCLDDAVGLRAWLEGWEMPLEQAVQEALDS